MERPPLPDRRRKRLWRPGEKDDVMLVCEQVQVEGRHRHLLSPKLTEQVTASERLRHLPVRG